MWLITVHALAVLAYANWANKVLSAPRCYESVVKSKALPSKCIHYSWSVICLQRACSKRQYSNRFSYSSVKDISTTAQNASLSDTVSFLKKESQPTGSLVSLEGIRFLFSCSQTIKAQRAPCQGCSHQAPLRQARHTWPPGTASLPEDCGPGGALPIPLLCEALPPTAGGCSTRPRSLFFSPFQPLGFIAVLILLLLAFCSLGMILHSHLLLCSHTAWQCFWSLQNANRGSQTKGLSQVPCPLHFTGNLTQNSHITVQIYRTDQKVTVSLVPIAHFAETCPVYLLTWDRFTSYLLLFLLVLSYENSHLLLSFLWNWATHYLLPSLFLFLFLSH